MIVGTYALLPRNLFSDYIEYIICADSFLQHAIYNILYTYMLVVYVISSWHDFFLYAPWCNA